MSTFAEALTTCDAGLTLNLDHGYGHVYTHSMRRGGAWIFVRTYRNVSSRQVWRRVMNVVARVYVSSEVKHVSNYATRCESHGSQNCYRARREFFDKNDNLFAPIFQRTKIWRRKKELTDDVVINVGNARTTKQRFLSFVIKISFSCFYTMW